MELWFHVPLFYVELITLNAELFTTSKKARFLLPGFLFLWLLTGCGRKCEILYFGETMGTTYSIKLSHIVLNEHERDVLKSQIDSTLQSVNEIMSTYMEDSEISRFNNNSSTEPFRISSEFHDVIKKGLQVFELSDGAFDITVHPLVKIWGFGNMGPRWQPPDDSTIQQTLAVVGFQNITLNANYLGKSISDLEIDLAGIAKGYGVDRVANLLENSGIENFMVEIGGEVFCAGVNIYNRDWQIGIQKPEYDFSTELQLVEAVSLSNMAMATSGNYRNFFDFEGIRYSHIVNPKTGYPVKNILVSATVFAEDCITADAFATAVLVLGVERGLELIEAQQNTECYLLEIGESGELIKHSSSGFEQFCN